jgi:hypothetical protein
VGCWRRRWGADGGNGQGGVVGTVCYHSHFNSRVCFGSCLLQIPRQASNRLDTTPRPSHMSSAIPTSPSPGSLPRPLLSSTQRRIDRRTPNPQPMLSNIERNPLGYLLGSLLGDGVVPTAHVRVSSDSSATLCEG